MPMSNEEVIRKATITVDQMAEGQGLLYPEQADKMLDFVEDETTMKGFARMVRVKGGKRLIEKINVADRVALPKAEAADPANRRGVSTSVVEIEPKEIMVPFSIEDSVGEESIEDDADIKSHVAKMMGKRLANNLEQLFWYGDPLGPAILHSDWVEGGSASDYRKDTYYGLINGWLKRAESGHVVDAQNQKMSPALMNKALKALPTKFRKNKMNLKFFASADHEQDYRDSIGSRATPKGDQALNAEGNLPAYGVELVPVALLMPEPQYVENSVGNSDGTTPTALSFAPIDDLILTPTTLGLSPIAPFVLATDYTVDEAAGTWTSLLAGIGAGVTVKATYLTAGRMILTLKSNLVWAVSRDIRVERARNIWSTTDEYAITVKVDAVYEEVDAVVLVKNIQVAA